MTTSRQAFAAYQNIFDALGARPDTSYGFKDLHEFTAEISGNPEFRRDKTITINNTTHKLHEDINKTTYEIPSEFIDVSIGNFNDSSRIHFIDNYKENEPYIYKHKYVNPADPNHKINIEIYSYSINDLSDDLENILFYQNSIYPWIDNKYNKRLQRLLFFKHLEGHLKNPENKTSIKKIIDLCKIIRNKNYKIEFNDVKQFLNDKNLPVENKDVILNALFNNFYSMNSNTIYNLNLKSEYDNVKLLFNMLLIHNKLLINKLNDPVVDISDKALNKYNEYREKVLLYPLRHNKINDLFEKYKQFIDNIIIYNYDLYDVNINPTNIQAIFKDEGTEFIYSNKYDIYHDKYLKYKQKYNQLKKELGVGKI